jgi:hypothetical protein
MSSLTMQARVLLQLAWRSHTMPRQPVIATAAIRLLCVCHMFLRSLVVQVSPYLPKLQHTTSPPTSPTCCVGCSCSRPSLVLLELTRSCLRRA